jgi:hypothetical protein
MLKNWLFEYWWILVALLYVVLIVILARALGRRGKFERTWPKITLATTCVIIVLIPTMHSPMSYVVAVISVFNVLVLFRSTFTTQKSSAPLNR